MKRVKSKREKSERQLQIFFAVEKQADYSAHLQQTVKAVQSASQSYPRHRHIGFLALVLKQLRFIALKIWLVQGMLLSVLCALFLFFYDRGVIRFREYIPRGTLTLCGCVIVLSARPLLLRQVRCKMLEVEQATYFSNRGGILAQLLFIGIGDVGMLVVLILLAIRYRVAAVTIFLFLVIPFLTAASAGLMLWVRATSSFFQKAWIPVCAASSCLVCETAKESLALSQNIPLIFWSFYALVCVCILCCEYRRLCRVDSMERLL